MRRKRKCLACKKIKPTRGRTLCDSCYEAARRMVNTGKTTWAKLEKKKLASPAFDSPFRRAVANSK